MNLFLTFCFAFILSCSSNLQKNDTSKDDKTQQNIVESVFTKIIGVFFMPNTNIERYGMVFTSENSFRGFDGCNTFYGKFSYSEKEGFKLKSLIFTELKCKDDNRKFDPDFLYGVKSFEIKENQIVFYDKDKNEKKRLYTLINIQKEVTLPSESAWKMIKSNHQNFKIVQENKAEPYIKFSKNRNFTINYGKSQKNNSKNKTNYFSGYINLNEKSILLYVMELSTASTMNEGEDSQLGYDLKSVNEWEVKNNLLTLKNTEHYFVFEKL